MTKKSYYATVEGFLFGRYRAVGDPIGMLSADEAQYPEQMGQIAQTPSGQPTSLGGSGAEGGSKGGKA